MLQEDYEMAAENGWSVYPRGGVCSKKAAVLERKCVKGCKNPF